MSLSSRSFNSLSFREIPTKIHWDLDEKKLVLEPCNLTEKIVETKKNTVQRALGIEKLQKSEIQFDNHVDREKYWKFNLSGVPFTRMHAKNEPLVAKLGVDTSEKGPS